MRKPTILCLLALLPLFAKAQNDVQISHQLFNRVYYNPAAAGASQYLNGILIARQQWVGFPKSPQTMVFSADGYLPKANSGLGLSAIVDRLGFERSLNVNLSYAYHIKVSDRSNLSLGLSAGVMNKSVDAGGYKFIDPSDPNAVASMANDSKLVPDFNIGVEFNREDLTLGAAVTHLDKSPSKTDEITSARHFYAYGRYKFELSPQWDLVPTLSMQNSVKDYQLEANLMGFFQKRYWIGASYRVNEQLEPESMVAIVGLYITDYLRLGYAYDLNVGNIGAYTSGSHELMLGIRIKPKTNSSSKTPRLFLEY